MMILALLVSGLSGALAAVLACKAIQLKLWADILAGAGAIGCMYAAGHLAGAAGWPFFGFLVGAGAVVAYLRLKGMRR